MQDKFYSKARREGYRARSVYKLMEIQKKYNLIRKGDVVLDLGCAPGSWLQVVSQWVGNGFVLGVDISPVHCVAGNVVIWKKSVMDEDIKEKLQTFLQERKKSYFSVILSDMAPKTKGIPYVDQRASFDLAKRAYDIALEVLAAGGHVVCKVFQSKEAEEFLSTLRKSFSFVKMIDVTATKKGSKEMYYVCMGYKA